MAHEDTRQKILDASIDLFCEHGFTKASMRDIARTGDVTLSVIYNYFKDKYDILYTIIIGIGSDLEKLLDEAIEDSTPGVDALTNIITAQMCLIKDRPKEIKIYLEDQYLLPESPRSVLVAQHRAIYNRYYRQVEILEQEGLLQHVDKTVVTFSILGVVNWAYRWFNNDGRLSMEEVAGNTVHLFLRGILKP